MTQWIEIPAAKFYVKYGYRVLYFDDRKRGLSKGDGCWGFHICYTTDGGSFGPHFVRRKDAEICVKHLESKGITPQQICELSCDELDPIEDEMIAALPW